MTMVWIGVGMIVVGYLMISFMGLSAKEHEQGKEYTTSDNIGGFLLVAGAVITAAFGLWELVRFLWGKGSQFFYGADASYAHLSFWDECAYACAGAAVFFFLSMMTELRAEAQYRKWRHHDHAKARRIRGQLKSYVGIHYYAGILVLLVTFGCVLAKTL
jgi:hypothetical protein